MALPHDENTLAIMVNVHIRGGSKDLATHLSGLFLRVAVAQKLIEIMRHSGYAGYENRGINAPDKVAQRLKERYTDVYGQASFIPKAVIDAINVQKLSKTSIVQDKIATPSDNTASVTEWDKPCALIRFLLRGVCVHSKTSTSITKKPLRSSEI